MQIDLDDSMCGFNLWCMNSGLPNAVSTIISTLEIEQSILFFLSLSFFQFIEKKKTKENEKEKKELQFFVLFTYTFHFSIKCALFPTFYALSMAFFRVCSDCK